MFTRRVLSLSLVALALAGCATVSTPVSVADSIAKNPSLSTLSGLIGQAGLTATLQSTGPFTVFAPSNDAFKAVPAKTMDDLAKVTARMEARKGDLSDEQNEQLMQLALSREAELTVPADLGAFDDD